MNESAFKMRFRQRPQRLSSQRPQNSGIVIAKDIDLCESLRLRVFVATLAIDLDLASRLRQLQHFEPQHSSEGVLSDNTPKFRTMNYSRQQFLQNHIYHQSVICWL